MDLSDLRSIQSRERETEDLPVLEDSFYSDALSYLQEMRARREQAIERAENPYRSDEVARLTDDIEEIELLIESIFSRRVSKILRLASLEANDDQRIETGRLTPEEGRLYEDLLTAILDHRESVLEDPLGKTDKNEDR